MTTGLPVLMNVTGDVEGNPRTVRLTIPTHHQVWKHILTLDFTHQLLVQVQGVKFLYFPIFSYFSQHTPIFPIFQQFPPIFPIF